MLLATGVSDAKMEEGSLRCDANVSVRRPGTPFGTRCEIKNLNSIRSLGRAIEYEARRQIAAIGDGETIRQETRHWDEGDGRTHTLRVKENSDDYRYFPEPDLLPLEPDRAWLDDVRARLPMLPAERRMRLGALLGVSPNDETVVVLVERGRDGLVAATVAAGGDGGRAAVHLQHNTPPEGDAPVSAPALAALTKMEVDGRLTATQAKTVVAALVAAGGDGDPAAIAAANGVEAMDTGALAAEVDAAIAAQPDAWAKFLAGDDKVTGAFVGSVMKATRGKADGKAVTALLQQRRAAGA